MKPIITMLKKWPASRSALLSQLRLLPPPVQFEILWPIAVRTQTHGPAAPAAALLLELDPPCPFGCAEALECLLLIGWDVSIEEVPWYLVRRFGQQHVITVATELSRSLSGTDSAALNSILYWAELAKSSRNVT